MIRTALTLPIALPIALFSGGCGNAPRVPLRPLVTVELSFSFTDHHPRQLELRFGDGLAIFEPGATLRCELMADVTAAVRHEAQTLAEQLQPQVVESDGNTTIGLVHPQGLPLDGVYTRYLVQVPKGVSLRVRSDKGRVCVRRLGGTVNVRTDTGDIQIDLDGASVVLHTQAGTVTVRGRFPRAEVTTTVGVVYLSVPPQTEQGTEIALRSETGALFLDLPEDQCAALTLIGARESVQSELPITWLQGGSDSAGHEGQLGLRDAELCNRLRVETGGRLTVRRAPARGGG